MDQTPKQLIEDVEFREVRRGYDPAEVDAFLDRVAAAMTKLQEQVGEADARARSAETRAQAAETEAKSAPPADNLVDGTEQLQRTLILAQRTAAAAVKEGRDEAEAMRAEANAEAARLAAEARAEADRITAEATEASQAELREIDVSRQSLLADVAILEQNRDAHRDRIKTAIAELERHLKDPGLLQVDPAEGLSAEAGKPPKVKVGDSGSGKADSPKAQSGVASPDPGSGGAKAPSVDGRPPVKDVDLIDLGSDSDVDAAVDAEPGAPTVGVGGPPTEAIDVTTDRPPAASGNDDDAFLAELRKAMTDNQPLGPRNESEAPFEGDEGADDDSRPRPRFGRRR